MKKALLISFALFLLTLSIRVSAQILHYSQHVNNPLYYNPAFTGYINSTGRIVATYADRYRQSFGKDGIRNIFASADFNIPIQSSYDSKSGIGIGAFFYNQSISSNAITDNVAAISLSYRLSLGKDDQHVLSAGFQGQISSKKFNYGDLQFGNQFNGFFYNPNISSGEFVDLESELNFNAGLGLLYAFTTNKVFSGYIGGSVFHLIPENNSVITFSQGLRFNIHGGLDIEINKLKLQPTLMYDQQGKAIEIYVGNLFKYYIQDSKSGQLSIFVGPYLRMFKSPVGDFSLYTMNILGGLQYNNFELFIVADNTINTSKQTFGGFNGFEVGLNMKFGNSGNKKQPIYCPAFR